MPQTYDTIVIGAGIVGCCTAFALQQKGQQVLLVDRSATAATGASGAAGAFVSPKIGKGSPLQALTNEAFHFAKDFYLKYFSAFFYQTGVIRIPKDAEDAEKFKLYEVLNAAKYCRLEKEDLQKMGIFNAYDSFLFEEAGVCDAPEMCQAILEQVPFKQFEVSQMNYDKSVWILQNVENDTLRASNVVLCTGYENKLFDMRYMGVRGTWGSRGDYYSALKLNVCMHKTLSISANIHGIVKIGASHVKSKTPCLSCDGEPLKELFEKASDLVDTKDFVLKETFCGMRAGSKDYFPLVGRVVDVPFMFENFPNITRGEKATMKHLSNLYICNGVGGRGFVFAPLMAEWLSELIVNQKEIDKRVNPDRLFLKWARKLRAKREA